MNRGQYCDTTQTQPETVGRYLQLPHKTDFYD